jgi:nitrate reductase gamma subunit
MTTWIAGILLTISLLGGLARLGLVLLSPTGFVQVIGLSMSKQKMLVLGIVNITFSILGFVLLVAETFRPIEILIGVLLITTLPEIAFNIRRPKAGV